MLVIEAAHWVDWVMDVLTLENFHKPELSWIAEYFLKFLYFHKMNNDSQNIFIISVYVT